MNNSKHEQFIIRLRRMKNSDIAKEAADRLEKMFEEFQRQKELNIHLDKQLRAYEENA